MKYISGGENMTNRRNDNWKHDTLKMKPIQSSANTFVDPSLKSNEYRGEERKVTNGYKVTLIVIASLIVCLSVVLAVMKNSTKPAPQDENDILITDAINNESEEESLNTIPEYVEDEVDTEDEEPVEEKTEEKPEKPEDSDETSDDNLEPPKKTEDTTPSEIPPENVQAPESIPDTSTNTSDDNSPGDIPDISELE